MTAVETGHILAATDVFLKEPLDKVHPVRQLKGIFRSAHRAGALENAFKNIDEIIIEDLALMDKGLPPIRCKRAEREAVSRIRSRCVKKNKIYHNSDYKIITIEKIYLTKILFIWIQKNNEQIRNNRMS